MSNQYARSHIFESDPYSHTQSSKGSLPVHGSYYSPSGTPHKSTAKLTPKSILKESLSSSAKMRKNIQINERLNQVQKYPKKKGSRDVYNEKRPKIVAPKDRDTIGHRPNTTIGGSLNGRYGMQAETFASDSSDSKKTRFQNPSFDLNEQYVVTQKGGKNEGVPVNANGTKEELSAFQMAYIRKLQRERELEIHSNMLESPQFDGTYQTGKVHDLFRSQNDRKSSTQTRRSDGGWGLDKFPNLDHIEDKIYELEKNLESYSNRLRDSLERQKDLTYKNDIIGENYEAYENSIRSRREEQRSFERRGPSVSSAKNSERKSRRGEGEEGEEETNRESAQGTSEMQTTRRAAPIIQYVGSKGFENEKEYKEMRQELDYLREENDNLKTVIKKTHRSQAMEEMSNREAVDQVVEKEKELLKAIDRIRSKLHKSIGKKTIKEDASYNPIRSLSRMNERIERLAQPKKIWEDKKKKDVNSERTYLARKAYGGDKLEKENANILYNGLSTSYNGFHWNADQSLKLNRKLY